jgi:hypothetical protein
MPHSIGGATGCTLNEGMQILMLLFHLHWAEISLLVYHSKHVDSPPIDERTLSEGFPTLPFLCSECSEEIVSENELSYDFLFRVQPGIQFIVTEYAPE